MRALEAGLLGGVTQHDAVPRQSSTMRDRHLMRYSISSRPSMEYDLPPTTRRKAFSYPRHMPAPNSRADHRRASMHVTRPPVIFSRPRASSDPDTLRSNVLRGPPVSRLPKRTRLKSISDSSKPFPPLPQRPQEKRECTVSALTKLKLRRQSRHSRSRAKSLPVPLRPGISPRQTLRDFMLSHNTWTPRPPTPDLTYLDGSVESSSLPSTPCDRTRQQSLSPGNINELPSNILPQEKRARSAEEDDDSKRTTLDGLYDSYFDAHFEGWSVFTDVAASLTQRRLYDTYASLSSMAEKCDEGV